jgi:acyl carrier protein
MEVRYSVHTQDRLPTARSIASTVLDAIARCLEASGRKLKPISGNQSPIAAIPGFDSLCGLEVTTELEHQLHVKLDQNIFVKSEGSRAKARTLDEICKALIAAVREEI